MGEITALEPQKKNPKRVNLFVDGKFVVGLDLETVVKEKLEVGRKLSEKEIKSLVELSGRRKIFDKVFKFLSYRPRSQKEVRDYLIKRKVAEEEITDILKELSEKKYLDDEEFARWWVEQRMMFRPKGHRALEMELRQKGVAKEAIAELLDRYLAEGGNEQELAKKVAEKKLKTLSHLPVWDLRQKLVAVLARRGFSWEIIDQVVDGILKKK